MKKINEDLKKEINGGTGLQSPLITLNDLICPAGGKHQFYKNDYKEGSLAMIYTCGRCNETYGFDMSSKSWVLISK